MLQVCLKGSFDARGSPSNFILVNMKVFLVATLLSELTALVATTTIPLPPDLPQSIAEFRAKYPYEPSHLGLDTRHVVTLRPSRNDTDDVSADFKAGLEHANHGGTLYLPANQTFVIGQPLDLTFLDDVHLRLDGEIKFTDDTSYWQSVAFTHPFQNTIMFWKWGGQNVKIYGDGVLNGNGQRWWNEFAGNQILDPDNAYLRPVLFYAENATDFVIEGVHMKDSPCWNNFIVTCESCHQMQFARSSVLMTLTKVQHRVSSSETSWSRLYLT